MRRLFSLLIALLLLGSGGGLRAEEGPDAAEIARLKAEMALTEEVAAAVARSAAWIRKQQQKDGSFLPPPLNSASLPAGVPTPKPLTIHVLGKTALSLLALGHAGAGPDDEGIEKGLAFVQRKYPVALSRKTYYHGATYSLSLVAMALHRLYRMDEAGEVPQWARLAMKRIGNWLVETLAEDGLFGYPAVKVKRRAGRAAPGGVGFRTDLSNTQYAMLGLWAASRCGFEPATGELTSLAECLIGAQVRNGPSVKRQLDPTAVDKVGAHTYAGVTDRARGFSYSRPIRSAAMYATGSMTAGGLSSLLIAKAMLLERDALEERLRRRLDHGIWDAIGWLTHNYDLRVNPSSIDFSALPEAQQKAMKGHVLPSMGSVYHFYYLYGLERALVIAGKRFLGTHDWYLEGARILVDAQEEDGRWRPLPPPDPKHEKADHLPPVPAGGRPGAPLVDTCFCVLFLQRASLRPRSPLPDTTRKK